MEVTILVNNNHLKEITDFTVVKSVDVEIVNYLIYERNLIQEHLNDTKQIISVKIVFSSKNFFIWDKHFSRFHLNIQVVEKEIIEVYGENFKIHKEEKETQSHMVKVIIRDVKGNQVVFFIMGFVRVVPIKVVLVKI